jgi:hypothetical protein
MPVILLWGIPTLIVLAGGTYLIIHHWHEKRPPSGGLFLYSSACRFTVDALASATVLSLVLAAFSSLRLVVWKRTMSS